MVTIVNGRYKLVRRLGGGAFGEVFLAVTADPALEQERFAVKLEPLRTSHQPHLHHEAKLYIYMSRNTTTVGIPQIRWFGVEGEYTILVMELLGPSLEDIFDYCKHKFTHKTILTLAEQMVCRLQFVHGLSYLHRDIKPENFVMGLGKKSHHLYVIDFGLAKRYADWRTGKHIPYIEGKGLTGTARFVSLNTHLGVQQARRDDLEGVAYVIIYLARGSLPWQGIRCPNKIDKYERIKNMKLEITAGELCHDLPMCYERFLLYARSLEFEDNPDYMRCRQMFLDELEYLGEDHDFRYCWEDRGESTGVDSADGRPIEGISRGNSFAAISSGAIQTDSNVYSNAGGPGDGSPRGGSGAGSPVGNSRNTSFRLWRSTPRNTPGGTPRRVPSRGGPGDKYAASSDALPGQLVDGGEEDNERDEATPCDPKPATDQ